MPTLISAASGEQIGVDGHSSGNRVQDGVPGLRPMAEQKHGEGSNRPPVSPIKKKPAALTAYENILQNEGKSQNQAEKGSQKPVTQIESNTKLSSPGSKKTQAPSPPSSPPDSVPKGGNVDVCVMHPSATNSQNATASPTNSPSRSFSAASAAANMSASRPQESGSAASVGMSRSPSLPASSGSLADKSSELKRKSFVLPHDLVTRL